MRIPKVGVVENPQRQNWLVQYTLDGKRVRKTKPTRREAEVLARRFQALLDEGKDPLLEHEKKRRKEAANRITLHEFYPVFMRRHGCRQAKKTQELYDTVIEHFKKWDHIGWRIFDLPLAELKVSIIEEYRTSRLEDDRVTSATVNRYTCNVLKGMLNKAVKWDMLEANPLAMLEPLKENERRDVGNLTLDTLSRLLTALKKPLSEMFETSLLTGLRRNEFLKLRIEDVILYDVPTDKGEIKVLGKGGKRRTVPLCTQAVNLLRRVIGDRTEGYVWTNPKTGKPYVSIHKVFRRIVKKLDIRIVGGNLLCIHDGRRLFGHFFLQKGGTPAQLREIYGHADLATTDNYARTVVSGVDVKMPTFRNEKAPVEAEAFSG